MHLVIHCDGASRGNPGEAAAGVLVRTRNGDVRARLALRLGVMTNNQAEYHAVLSGMQLAAQLGATAIEFRVDSQLIARQLAGVWRIKDAALRALADRVAAAAPAAATVRYMHVERAQNREADRLANWALDQTRIERAAPGG